MNFGIYSIFFVNQKIFYETDNKFLLQKTNKFFLISYLVSYYFWMYTYINLRRKINKIIPMSLANIFNSIEKCFQKGETAFE